MSKYEDWMSSVHKLCSIRNRNLASEEILFMINEGYEYMMQRTKVYVVVSKFVPTNNSASSKIRMYKQNENGVLGTSQGRVKEVEYITDEDGNVIRDYEYKSNIIYTSCDEPQLYACQIIVPKIEECDPEILSEIKMGVIYFVSEMMENAIERTGTIESKQKTNLSLLDREVDRIKELYPDHRYLSNIKGVQYG